MDIVSKYGVRGQLNQSTLIDSGAEYVLTGMVNQKMDPCSGSEVTPMTPPINLTSWRDIERPKPVPPKRRVDEF